MSVPGPTLGPCQSWIEGSDVASCPPCSEAGTGDASLDLFAVEASMALFEISGRKFTGLCETQVRPCRGDCSCWGAYPDDDWYWPDSWPSFGWVGWPGWYGWRSRGGYRCGCEPTSDVPLAGYPVRQITEVKIDGTVLDPLDDNGNPNYELRGWDRLVRMDDPGPPVVKRRWPSCQKMSLTDEHPGTFSITYKHGVEPPPLGQRAAIEIACQLWLSCPGSAGSQACKLPTGTTRVTRQGVTVDKKILLNWFEEKNRSTGLVSVDLFLRSYGMSVAPGSRQSAVWSPDLPEFPERVT